ncbi:hypothetical protein CMO83_01565 [Candidatus Woesearchaeota archaeon]|jgi:hypothetical protein|nr:hypothetical protein [Candidatus Woesearchaeota archaeon]MDP6648001.1 PKD domain-containing protein [Candidatus Woesearchaeota archaeon]|tara:strand:- start:38938 stop:41226 length:2289 start_codon:yes stop_codon:yes gene_type:complete
MKRNIALLVIIFLVFPYFVYSLTTFVIQETDEINLKPEAIDPDNDDLVTTYDSPLNENGSWQTTYGDAGEYKTAITVSDGLAIDSEDILIIVERKEEPPTIDLFVPEEDPVNTKESDTIQFRVSASDLNNDPLTYEWYLDGTIVKEGQEYFYSTSYSDAGTHKVIVIVSDGLHKVSEERDVNVQDIDIQRLLDDIQDVTVNENEIARLELLDFEKYGLTYTISEPLGNRNEWQTTYDGEGSYNINVKAEGNGFSGETDAEVVVNNVDRPPIFDRIGSKVINENQEIIITLSATDPDGEEVTYSVERIPAGAEFKENVFTWTPGFDTVKKDDFVDYVMDKLNILTKSFYVKFVASSQDQRVVRNVIITVRDVNRAPILEDFDTMTINEGETVNIAPKAYDLDGDKLSFSYSGFMNSDTYESGFDDAGNHTVTVTVSDGRLEDSKNVQIIIRQSNRAPVLNKIKDIKANEGDTVTIVLDAHDPDGDHISYSIENPPADFTLKENVFTWVPHSFIANYQGPKTFDFVFAASDGQATSKQVAKVEVTDKNRPPRIINATQGLITDVNQPVFMFVKAVDDDNNQLTYTWDFGLLEKYKAGENLQRVYTTPGSKTVIVTVSDGIDEAHHVMNVFVRDSDKELGLLFNDTVYLSIRKINVTVRETKVFNQVVIQDGSSQVAAAQSTVPRIVDYSRNLVVKVNDPVLMFVKAVDDDNNQLTYTWDFGLFDRHKGTQYHQRTFTSRGNKAVKVTVSDGTHSVTQLINVNVV